MQDETHCQTHRPTHPWLDGRFGHPPSMAPVLSIWTFLAGHVATGDLEGVATDWRHLPDQGHAGGLEIILQTLLFAGFPRAINALAVVRELGVADMSPPPDTAQAEQHLAAGEDLCGRIYGRAYQPLRERMTDLHPAVDRWMVEIGYGRVLSRQGATPRERELGVIAVLAGQNVAAQLESHLRGAQRVGASAEECAAVLRQTHAVWGDDAQRNAEAIWQRVTKP